MLCQHLWGKFEKEFLPGVLNVKLIVHPLVKYTKKVIIKGERGKGEGPGEGGGSQKELGKGPGVVDWQRCCGFPEQSCKGRI